MTDFLYKAPCNFNPDYAVIIEDDGIVAYAYLLFNEEIIADIWLYNQAETPEETEWNEDDMPFLNPAEFVKEGIYVRPLSDGSDFECKWSIENGLINVDIYLYEILTARLQPDTKPGWSALVKKEGPLARILE